MLYVKVALIFGGFALFAAAPSLASRRFRKLVERHRRAKLEGRVPMDGAVIVRRSDASYRHWLALAFVIAMVGVVL